MMDIDLAAEALDKLLGLAEAGLLDRGMAGGIEDALAQGNPALLQSYINDLAAYEANAYFYGADADIRSLRKVSPGALGRICHRLSGSATRFRGRHRRAGNSAVT